MGQQDLNSFDHLLGFSDTKESPNPVSIETDYFTFKEDKLDDLYEDPNFPALANALNLSFFLMGSRRWETTTYESDWDYCVYDNDGTVEKLFEVMGWDQIDQNHYLPSAHVDMSGTLYTRPDGAIHVLLMKNVYEFLEKEKQHIQLDKYLHQHPELRLHLKGAKLLKGGTLAYRMAVKQWLNEEPL